MSKPDLNIRHSVDTFVATDVRFIEQNDALPLPIQQTGIYFRRLKRGIDLLIVSLGAIFAAPVVGLLALAIFIHDRKSPFYAQMRVGQAGRIYKMWKLRSMVPNADALLAAYLDVCPEARQEWAQTQKLKKDPRITRLGRILRATSMDELPQLWNVFNGDMSLVGPRPILPEQRILYPGSAYYTLRPGITGLWQVSSRNDTSFADRARFDAEYAEKLSFITDIGLLFRTIGVVFRATGY